MRDLNSDGIKQNWSSAVEWAGSMLSVTNQGQWAKSCAMIKPGGGDFVMPADVTGMRQDRPRCRESGFEAAGMRLGDQLGRCVRYVNEILTTMVVIATRWSPTMSAASEVTLDSKDELRGERMHRTMKKRFLYARRLCLQSTAATSPCLPVSWNQQQLLQANFM